MNKHRERTGIDQRTSKEHLFFAPYLLFLDA